MAKYNVQIQGDISFSAIHQRIQQSTHMEKLRDFVDKTIKEAGLKGYEWAINIEIIEPETEKQQPIAFKNTLNTDEVINPGPKPLQAGPKPLQAGPKPLQAGPKPLKLVKDEESK